MSRFSIDYRKTGENGTAQLVATVTDTQTGVISDPVTVTRETLPAAAATLATLMAGANAGDVQRELGEAIDRDCPVAEPKSVRELVASFPALRPPIIHGLLREGETMNVIAPPKAGKSWSVYDLAIAVATGHMWLGLFQTTPADVLILDNELHPETSAYRIPKVAAARGVTLDEYADHICVENLRGKLRDVFGFGKYFAGLEPRRFKIVIIDALYRAMPRDHDENDNGTMAEIFNALDSYASTYGLSFILIHHSSKGLQSGKAITDVGAGAGAQSRATDTHLILRQHEEEDVVVVDAVVRSFPPPKPFCLRWTFPVWTPEPHLDPTMLREGGRRRRTESDEPAAWTVETFVSRFITTDGRTKDEIMVDAEAGGLSARKAGSFLGAATAKKMAHKWTFGRAEKEKYATIPQNVANSFANKGDA
jgi:hypothetical protein